MGHSIFRLTSPKDDKFVGFFVQRSSQNVNPSDLFFKDMTNNMNNSDLCVFPTISISENQSLIAINIINNNQ